MDKVCKCIAVQVSGLKIGCMLLRQDSDSDWDVIFCRIALQP